MRLKQHIYKAMSLDKIDFLCRNRESTWQGWVKMKDCPINGGNVA